MMFESKQTHLQFFALTIILLYLHPIALTAKPLGNAKYMDLYLKLISAHSFSPPTYSCAEEEVVRESFPSSYNDHHYYIHVEFEFFMQTKK